jgi:SAM-dependent methyltransferase
MQKETYIWGAGHYGVLTALDLENKGIKIKGFIDKNAKVIKTRLGLPIKELNEIDSKNSEIIIAIQDNDAIKEIMEILSLHKFKFEISPLVSKPKEYLEIRKKETLDLIPTLKPLEVRNSPKYIVSLTSYGKRLADTAPYAIVTLLNQSTKPDNLILWVANEDKEKIPPIMEKLTQKGLEIRFCEDIKSYKKLILAIETFPDDYIITADDDVYYPENWLEQLIVEHQKYPKKIICHRAHGIKVDENYNLLPYLQWDSCVEPSNYSKRLEAIFPTGVGGILYPPKCLYKDIANKESFMKLVPYADDIWFWAMAVINKEYFGDESPYVVIENGYSRDTQSINLKQEQDGNALWNYNSQIGNDKNLKEMLEHYAQIKEYLQKIEPTKTFKSAEYWEERYAKGGNSGAGSYNNLAQFKAEILNDFVKTHSVQSVIEFGCGDGNQLSLAQYPKYLGFDVSETAINICKDKFSNDKIKEFRLISSFNEEKAELVLSLDVIYHLIEDSIFENYMKNLFEASTKYVIIYASNKTSSQWAQHVKHRRFTDWIDKNKPNWSLLRFIPNKYPALDNGENPTTSFADFYIFEKNNRSKDF